MVISDSKPHVLLVSNPGMGHLIPILELGKRLTTLHNLDVTIFVVASHTSEAETQVLQSAMASKLFKTIQLPPVDISGLLSPQPSIVEQLRVMMRQVKPSLRSAISALEFRPAGLIVDLFGTESFEIAKELGVPKYVYIGCNALFVALTLYAPTLDKIVEGEYVSQTEMLHIPSCRPFPPEDVVDPMLDRSQRQYFEYLQIGAEIPTGDGILINTWEDLQPATVSALRDAKYPVLPIGPIARQAEPVGSVRSKVVEWLDRQPDESVIYVSFGSGGTLSLEQIAEVAWGLELSQQGFIWVVHTPAAKIRDATFFTTGTGGDDVATYLPNGFLGRTQKVGLVIPKWAPQVDILSHRSVGGFLTHGGWNSAVESIGNGVPMIAWPLYAEQRLNATVLTEEIGVAIRSKVMPWKGVVGREEIAMMIKKIMVEQGGSEIRKRVKEFKCSGEKAVCEGGSSHRALSTVAAEFETSWRGQKD